MTEAVSAFNLEFLNANKFIIHQAIHHFTLKINGCGKTEFEIAENCVSIWTEIDISVSKTCSCLIP